jgi:hypothetical protein
LQIDARRRLLVSGKPLAGVPLSTWFYVEILCELCPKANRVQVNAVSPWATPPRPAPAMPACAPCGPDWGVLVSAAFWVHPVGGTQQRRSRGAWTAVRVSNSDDTELGPQCLRPRFLVGVTAWMATSTPGPPSRPLPAPTTANCRCATWSYTNRCRRQGDKRAPRSTLNGYQLLSLQGLASRLLPQ